MLALLLFTRLLQITCAFTTEVTNSAETLQLDKRQGPIRGGIRIEEGTCLGVQLQILQNAIQDASYLAAAGLEAASNFRSVPFDYFFKNDIQTAKDVGAVLQRIIDTQKGLGEPIYGTCKDHYKRCGNTDAGYTAQQLKPAGRPPVIVFCPVGLNLKRNPKPCTTRPGAISLGWLMVHQLVLVKSIAGTTWPIVDMDGPEMASEVAGRRIYEDTTKLADAYAHLGSWSYDLGLGFEPWHQTKNCRNKFWVGQFNLRGLDATSPST
ncbi:MAG: hypothetical protein Q9198_005112 [Flavoplaca austrocitrina]